MVHEDRGRILFVLVSVCVVGKNLNTPVGAPWLMTPLHGAVEEFWDLLSVSVSMDQMWVYITLFFPAEIGYIPFEVHTPHERFL